MNDLFGDFEPDYAALALNSEPNDIYENADPITEDGTYEITGSGMDWFVLEVVSGEINIGLTPLSEFGGRPQNMNIALFRDPEGSALVGSSNPGGESENLSFLAPEDGTYYLRTIWAQYPDGEHPDGVTYTYELDVELPKEMPSDGNDTLDTATPITESGTSSHSGTSVDWYRIDSLSGTMNFSMTPTAGQNLSFTLYDADGNPLRGGQGPDEGTETISHTIGQDGTYYLKVFWARYPDGAPNGVTIDYELEVALPEEMPSDGNDTLDTATPITASGTSSHSGTGVDWYRIDTVSGSMDFSMTPTAGQNLSFTLYDADGNVLRGGQGPAEGTETISHVAGTDGTYYLQVFWARYPNGAPNGITIDYDLTVDLPVEQPSDGNDTLQTATRIGHGTETRSGTGIDWYRFTSGPGLMDFSMTARAFPDGTVPNLNLTLYDANGRALRGNLNNTDTESFSYMALEQTEYYLRVNWATYPEGAPNGYTMTYDLSLDLPQRTWTRPLEFGPVNNASVTVYDIDNDGVDEIFAGTSKYIDGEGNEARQAGLVVLEHTGAIKWTQTFDGSPGADVATGKTYETTSISTAPVFSDLDSDGSIDIVVGVGADNGRDGFGVIGQPGDMGGVYALNADGSVKWFFQTRDTFGDDNRSDGVYGTPRVFDIDNDGVREVIFTSWDHYLYILDGRTGLLEREFNLHDTAGSTPAVGDIDGDGLFDLIVSSDISENAMAGLDTQGGMLQVLTGYAQPIIDGWKDQLGNSTSAGFRGKFDEQSLWSSPQLVDLDRNGTLEIVQGTGDYFRDGRGEHVRVWNSDGTLRFELPTNGRVLADALVADLDGDGRNEIIAATTTGHVHAWSAGGRAQFTTNVIPFGTTASDDLPIVGQPIAVDINGDDKLEILVSVGSQMIALNSEGRQISGLNQADRVFNTYAGSPVARDVDGDGRLDLISGGSTFDRDQGMVFRFENPFDVESDTFRTGAYQGAQSLHDIQDFVDRFYSTILGREADPAGLNNWVDRLYTGVRTGADVARGFVFSPEFGGRGTSNVEFVETLYTAFFDRPADATGLTNWSARLDGGMTRAQVLNGFIYSQEFSNLANSYGILVDSSDGPISDEAVIRGNPDDANMLHGGSGDSIIFVEGTGEREQHANDKLVTGQVFRLYGATLGRTPDTTGLENWIGGLQNNLELVQVANGFVNSAEFRATYGALDDEGFVSLLYNNVLGRDPDPQGLTNWVARLEDGMTRAQVVVGFSESAEYRDNMNPVLDTYMRTAQPMWIDVIEGGAGNDTMNGNTGGDIFVFRQGQGGRDVIHGFEPWDELQFSGFGYSTGSDAMAHMTQSGSSVVFNDQKQVITFLNTSMAEMNRVLYNVS